MGSSCSTVQKPLRPSETYSNKEKPLINGDISVKVVDSSFGLKSSDFDSQFLFALCGTSIECVTSVLFSSSVSMQSYFLSACAVAKAGSKDETFFESRAWLDSDCDDDFLSVNGDFTPSRGNTPNNQIRVLSREKSDKTIALDKFPDSKSEPSPSPTGRKRLSDLFQETREESAYEEKQETDGEHEEPTERANSVGAIGELAPSRELKGKKKTGGMAARCCLPSLSQSFSERKQKTSPIPHSA